MECLFCKGKMEKGKAPFHVDGNGYQLHLNSIPAWVCTQCGEAYFETREVQAIQKAISFIEKECTVLV